MRGGRLPSAAVTKTSAGILLYRGEGESLEVLLVHPGGPYWAKKDEGAWSIPKGEVEEAEESPASALVQGWAAEAEFDPAGLSSNTFSMEWPPRSGREREFPEVDRAEWFSPEQARRKINPAQAAFIDRLLER
jgi:predicted NUDIX family NTP pyrophosphohydrolase